ncbi:glutaminase A [Bacillus safensis FO-36b] [Bacillus safensis subsp. safensis]
MKTAISKNTQHACQSSVDQWAEEIRPYYTNGQNAGYIPALGKVNSSQLGISVIGPDGSSVRYGDWDVPFTLQSISKVISFIAACLGRGVPYVFDRVDVEPNW